MILEKMMDVSAYRHKLLASNIANVDTPGYKAGDISFQNELQGAIGDASNGIREKRSYNVFETTDTMPNRDGNTVNAELEMAKVAENTLIYKTAADFLSLKIKVIKSILTQR